MSRGMGHGASDHVHGGPAGWRLACHDGRGPPVRGPGLRMAGGSVHDLAQRRHRRAEHAGRRPLGARRRDLRWHRRDRWLRRGGAIGGWARPGGGTIRIRVGCGWFGHGVFPWYVGSAAASSATAWLAADRNAATEDGRAAASRRPAGRRQLPAAAAQGGRYRAVPVAGTGGCTQGEPPGASVPPLWDGMTSRSARPGQDRPPGGLDVAGLRRVAAADRDPGRAASIRDRHSRQVRSVASVMGRSDRDDRSGAHVLLR